MDNLLDMDDKWVGENLLNLYFMGIFISNHTLTHPTVQNFLKSNAKFDVVVLENFVVEAMLGFGPHFNASIVALSTFGPNIWINEVIGTPSPLSYVPHPFLKYTDNMNLFERIWNFIVFIMDYAMYKLFFLPKQAAIYEATFPDPKPGFDYLMKHGVSLAILNSHFSTSYPRPLVPNMIEIGGSQINRNPKPLPTDIQNFLDSAKDGAVYFSMGSNIKSTQLPAEKRQAILNTFAKFPKVKFLWKWEDPELPGKPANVFIQKWYPQDDILAHPNIKCFITHGGLLGTSEAIYNGVPLIGIPVFGDQDLNMARATNAGYGLKVAYKNLTEEALTWALTELLSKNSFKQRAVEISTRYRDQPSTPLDTAQFWIEYVARHKGAPHIRSAAQNLNFFQYHMIDVYIVIFLVFWLIYKAFQKTIHFLTGGAEDISKAVRGKKKKTA